MTSLFEREEDAHDVFVGAVRTVTITIVSILLRFLLVFAMVAAVDVLAAGSFYDVVVSAGISEAKIADVPSVAYDANRL